MYEFAVIWEWLSLAARWVHIITAIAWIGEIRNPAQAADAKEWTVITDGFACGALRLDHAEVPVGAQGVFNQRHIAWLKNVKW